MLQEKTESSAADQRKKRKMCNDYRTKRRTHQPWYGSWIKSKERCNNPNNKEYKNYGERGIKHDLLLWDMGVLWWRDKADLMKSPTIDREDNDGDYVFSNCRFIERSENARRSAMGNKKRIGHKHSEESKQKMSRWHTGVKPNQETRIKMSKAQTRRNAKEGMI